MSANCPPNDTDCLLRALVDANSGYNWNPLNFAFTAALSVLGFTVAIITLIQGLLAAGPGRLKASRLAIGHVYNQKASTSFNWIELRFRTDAKVPFLDIDVIRQPLKRRIKKPDEQSSFLAGWSQLLKDLDVEDIIFKDSNCPTDYVPEDIQAAPASGTVESLVIMAILAGCENIHRTEEYLRATGRNIQLDFRPHQTLGTVAAYRHFFETSYSKIDANSHSKSICEARGELHYNNDNDFKNISGLLVEDTSDLFFQINSTHAKEVRIEMNYDILLKEIIRRCTECDHPDCPPCVNDKVRCFKCREPMDLPCENHKISLWRALLKEEKPNQMDINKLATLLFAHKPTTARMFPTAAAQFRPLLNNIGYRKYAWFHPLTLIQDLLLLPESGVLIGVQKIRKPELQYRDDSTWFKNNFVPPKKFGELRSMAIQALRPELVGSKVFTEDCVIISDQALNLCFSWIYNGDIFVTMGPESRDGSRTELMLQLREVDRWLIHYGESDALCSAWNLMKIVQNTDPLRGGSKNSPQLDTGSDHDNDAGSDKENDAGSDHSNDSGSDHNNDAGSDHNSDASSYRSKKSDSNHDSNNGSNHENVTGFIHSDDKARTPERKKHPESRMPPPVYIRIARRWISPVTLEYYNLPWEYDSKTPEYIVILQNLDNTETDILFEHTRRLQTAAYKANHSDSIGINLYRIRRGGEEKKTQPNKSFGSSSGDNAQTSELPSKNQDANCIQEQGNNHSKRSTADGQDKVDDSQKNDITLASDGPTRSSIISHNSDRSTNNASSTHGLNKSESRKYSRMKAMETMLFYRAMLFACLLAASTDTSELLWLENKKQTVYVL